MSFHIYQNWTAENKAVLHEGSCKYCNHGKGCHKNIRGDKNGKWHGPFNSVEDVERYARDLRGKSAIKKPTIKYHCCYKKEI